MVVTNNVCYTMPPADVVETGDAIGVEGVRVRDRSGPGNKGTRAAETETGKGTSVPPSGGWGDLGHNTFFDTGTKEGEADTGGDDHGIATLYCVPLTRVSA